MHATGPGQPNSAFETHNIIYNDVIPPLSGAPITFRIEYEPMPKGTLLVVMSNIARPVIQKSGFDLVNYMSMDSDGAGYIGFTASTNRTGEQHDVLNWSYEFLGVASELNSKAFGAGVSKITAGDLAAFDVQLFDQYGNAFIANPQPRLAVVVQPTPAFAPTVSYTGRGVYHVTYNTTVAGVSTVAVTVDGKMFQGAPFATTVSPACGSFLAPWLTLFVGTGWSHAGSCMCMGINVSQQFQVLSLQDLWGNLCSIPLTLKFTIEDSSSSPMEPAPLRSHVSLDVPGRYNVSYASSSVGLFRMSVIVGSIVIAQIVVEATNTTGPCQCGKTASTRVSSTQPPLTSFSSAETALTVEKMSPRTTSADRTTTGATITMSSEGDTEGTTIGFTESRKDATEHAPITGDIGSLVGAVIAAQSLPSCCL